MASTEFERLVILLPKGTKKNYQRYCLDKGRQASPLGREIFEKFLKENGYDATS